MKTIDKITTREAYLYYKNDRLYKVSEGFARLTGYAQSDVVGKSFEELSTLLKVNPGSFCKTGKYIYEGYIFNNKDEPKHIKVTLSDSDNKNEKIYFIQENPNQFLKGVLSTCTDHYEYEKESVAIYSYPELIHLKVNKNYLNKCKLFSEYDKYSVGSVFHIYDYILDSIKERNYYYEEDMEFIDREGNCRYWTIKANVLYEESEAKYLKITYIDETEKVLTRKTLEKQKTEMQIILENIPDSIVKLNSKGEYTYSNKPNMDNLVPRIINDNTLTNNDVYKSLRYSDISGNELSFYDTPNARVLRGEKLVNYTVIETGRLPITYYNCNGIPIYDELGNVESALLIYRNVECQFKLGEYNALSKNLQNLEVNYARISYKDFKIEYVNNKCFSSIQKVHPSIKSTLKLIGMDFFDLYIDDSDQREEVKANIKNGIEKNNHPYIHTHRLIEEGKAVYIKAIFQPLLSDENEVEALSFIGMYITDEALANQEMSKALRAQEEIFVNTSHELKTPINLIFSASQLLSMYIKNGSSETKMDKIERSNQIIIQNCYRSIKLINNILDVSQIEHGYYKLDFKNMNIVNVIDSIVESVSDYIKEKDLTIIFDSEVEEKFMALDLYKFERIMLNLISNAIKFSNDDGVIFLNLTDKDDFVEVSVKDQGIGIDEENIDNIFNKFKQENKSLNRRTEGSGIGLSLVKSIVELHGGTISLTSTLNVGSTFTFTLPSLPVDGAVDAQDEYNAGDRVEMIKFELSDIYS